MSAAAAAAGPLPTIAEASRRIAADALAALGQSPAQ